MITTIKATFDGKVLRPIEPLLLPPNTEVTITIETLEEETTSQSSFLDTARSLNLEGPPDWSARLDEFPHGAEEEATMDEPRFLIEVITDPAEIARSREQNERIRRNSDWLQSHWADVLPQALGKHLAVAGQEAFIAETPEEAWAWARAAHPDDNGATVQYVRPEKGPRIYANAGRVAPLR